MVETAKESDDGGKGITKERKTLSSDDYPLKLRGDGGGKRSRRDDGKGLCFKTVLSEVLGSHYFSEIDGRSIS
jgi:hypothetical protein